MKDEPKCSACNGTGQDVNVPFIDCEACSNPLTAKEWAVGMTRAAPQPPALGGEPETIVWALCDGDEKPIDFTERWDVAKHWPEYAMPLIDRAHLAPLQAEIAERWEQIAELNSEAVQLKARNAELEGLSSEASEWIKANSYHGTDAIDLWQRIDAALSKPAGSEQV